MPPEITTNAAAIGIGEIAAVGAAVCWALSSFIYGTTRLSAWQINFAKNIFGSALVLLHLLIIWWASGQAVFTASSFDWTLLAISGLIGIIIGDTCYFRSLQILGPRRSLIITTISPVFAGILGWLWLGEILSVMCISGIFVAISGIAWVISDQRAEQEEPGLYPGTKFSGVMLGLAGALCQAAGGAISKVAMQNCSALEATFIRLLAAVVFTLVVMLILEQLKTTLRAIGNRDILKRLLPAAALGTWIGIWCSQIGFKDASSIAVAATLMATSPLFAIPMVRIFHGYQVSWQAIIGTIIAIVGIAIVVSY